MKDAVIIKSFPNGITLYLDSEIPFENVLDEISYKFGQARNFFGATAMALSIEGRAVTERDEFRILEAIQGNSDLRIMCLIGQDGEVSRNYASSLKSVENTKKSFSNDEDGQFFKGSLKNRDVLETENSIIMLGDVYPGSAVISAKNIIILGGLYGEAYAGGNGREGTFVAALEMEPERIKIGDFKYKPHMKQAKWGRNSKVQPKIAYVKNDKIVFETLTKDLLNTF